MSMSRIKNVQDVFTLWCKDNPDMGILAPMSTLVITDKVEIGSMKQRFSQHECIFDDHEKWMGIFLAMQTLVHLIKHVPTACAMPRT